MSHLTYLTQDYYTLTTTVAEDPVEVACVTFATKWGVVIEVREFDFTFLSECCSANLVWSTLLFCASCSKATSVPVSLSATSVEFENARELLEELLAILFSPLLGIVVASEACGELAIWHRKLWPTSEGGAP